MEFIEALNIPKSDDLYKYSDPIQAQINTNEYLGKDNITWQRNLVVGTI